MRFKRNSFFKNVKFGSSKRAYHQYRSEAKGYSPYNRTRKDPKGNKVHVLFIRQSKGTFLYRKLGRWEPTVSYLPYMICGKRLLFS